MDNQGTCIFCQIVAGESPAEIIWENDNHVAFLSIFPNTEGVAVVASREHLSSDITGLSDENYTQIMQATKTVANLLTDAFDDVARTGIVAEGFGVDHAHTKLFPMHGTAPMDEWREHPSQIDTFFEEYPGYLSSHDGQRIDREECKRVADKIRACR